MIDRRRTPHTRIVVVDEKRRTLDPLHRIAVSRPFGRG
jgi:hypothetical protein